MSTVFPIGHYVGQRHPEDLHLVRVGFEHRTMSEDEFGVWILCHQASPQWTTEDLVTLAASADLTDPGGSVERLRSAGLLVDADDPVGFARSHRLESLLVGFGNTTARPDSYAVGLPGRTPVSLDAGSYELWQWAAVSPSLWHTCEIRAKVSEATPADLVTEVFADLAPLLANSCGYLDRVG